jgi:hypothetical protein
MNRNKKSSKKVTILFAVAILIVILFLFFYKSLKGEVNTDSKGKPTTKTEELDGNSGKTSEENPSKVKGESKDNPTTAVNKDIKDQEKDKNIEDINKKEGITAFVEPASFGSTVGIVIDSNNFNNSYKYYQFFLGNKPISNIESISKSETTIFPAVEASSEVTLKLLDEDSKVLKELKLKLSEKK